MDFDQFLEQKRAQRNAPTAFDEIASKKIKERLARKKLAEEQQFIKNNPAKVFKEDGEPVIGIKLSPAPAGPKLTAKREALWGPAADLVDGLTVGLGGTSLQAGAGTLGRFLDEIIAGNPNAISNIPENFGSIFKDVRDAREYYEQEKPVTNMVTDIVGTIAPVAKGIQLAEMGGSALVKNVLPSMADDVTRFFGGQAGRRAAPIAGQSVNLPGTGNALLRTASRGTQWGTQGAIGAGLTANMYDVPVDEQIALGGGIGALLGASPLGRAAQGITDMAFPMLTPSMARSADLAAAEDIPISAMQLPPNQTWNAIYETFGQNIGNEQLNQANKLIFKSIGLPDTVDVSPQVFEQQRKKLGQDLDSIVSQVDVPVTPQLIGDLQGIAGNLYNDPIAMQGASNVYGLINKLVDTFNQYGGNIPGAEFRKLTGTNSTLDSLLSSENGYVRQYAAKVKNALYNAFENSTQLGTGESAAPLLKQFKDTRNQLANWYTISQSGAYNPTVGKVDPKKLGQYATPDVYFQKDGELSKINQLQNLLPNLSNAGAADFGHPITNRIMNFMGSGGLVGGGGAFGYAATGGQLLPAALAGAGTLAAASHGLTKLMESPSFRNMLLNKTLGGSRPISDRAGAIMESGNLLGKAMPSAVAKYNPWYSVFTEEERAR